MGKTKAGHGRSVPTATQAIKPKGFSDHNSTWLQPAKVVRSHDSGDDSLSDGDILDDEFQLASHVTGSGGTDQIDHEASGDHVSDDDVEDDVAQV